MAIEGWRRIEPVPGMYEGEYAVEVPGVGRATVRLAIAEALCRRDAYRDDAALRAAFELVQRQAVEAVVMGLRFAPRGGITPPTPPSP